MKRITMLFMLSIIAPQLASAADLAHDELVISTYAQVKTAVGTIVGATAGVGLINAVSYLFEKKLAHESRTGIVFAMIFGVAGSYCGGHLAWLSTAEGKISYARTSLEAGLSLSELIEKNNASTQALLNALDLEFSDQSVPRVAAFRKLSKLRENLLHAQKKLALIENPTSTMSAYCAFYKERIVKQLPLFSSALLIITNDPNWANYLATAEMVEASKRIQYQAGVQYHLN